MTRVTLVPGELEAHAAAGAEAVADVQARLGRLDRLVARYRWANPDYAADPTTASWWATHVFPGGRAWCGPGTYVGSGSILGSDGRRYPLVVPEVWHDGALVRGDADGSVGVATLGGRDPGWVTTEVQTGTGRVRDELVWWENLAVVSLGFNPAVTGRIAATPADSGVRNALRIDANGVPHLGQIDLPARGIPGPPAAPPPDPVARPHIADGLPPAGHLDGLAIAEHQTIDRAGAHDFGSTKSPPPTPAPSSSTRLPCRSTPMGTSCATTCGSAARPNRRSRRHPALLAVRCT